MKKKVLRTAFVGERLISFFIDYFIFMIVMAISFGVLLSVNDSLLGGSFLVGLLYIIFKDIVGGQSLGKRILKLEVREQDDLKVEIRRKKLVLRNLTFPILFIDFLFMFFNKQSQRLGDILTGTTVVKLTSDINYNENEAIEEYKRGLTKSGTNKKTILKILIAIILLGALFIGGLFFAITTTIKNGDAYKTAIQQIENNAKVLEKTGGIEDYGFLSQASVSINNGRGNAQFVIKVEGIKEDTRVYVELFKDRGQEWEVTNFYMLD